MLRRKGRVSSIHIKKIMSKLIFLLMNLECKEPKTTPSMNPSSAANCNSISRQCETTTTDSNGEKEQKMNSRELNQIKIPKDQVLEPVVD